MKMLFYFLITVFAALAIGCKSDSDRVNDLPTNNPMVNDATTVIASINGIVVDEQNNPLNGVTVNSGSNTTVTGRYGDFSFTNISMSEKNAMVKVAHPGYFTAYRTFIATAGRMHEVRIKLIPKTNIGSFPAAAGGTITLAGGAKIMFPAAIVADASGSVYSGTVNVAATWLNPNEPDINVTTPGSLRGINTGGQERVLETYGMLGVELTDGNGQALKIVSGKTAELTFPIPTAAQAAAPTTIPLWYFDEATARWKEEGRATKNGSNYVGNVSHFSFWNVDQPFPQINLCIKLLNSNGQPVNNAFIVLQRLIWGTGFGSPTGGGITNEQGDVCGIVPANEVLVIKIMIPCGNSYTTIFSQNIGPFNSNTSITQTVNIPSQNQLTITGRLVNCLNAPVTNGRVSMYITGGGYYNVGINNNGNFSISALFCSTTASYRLQGFDFGTSMQSNPVPGSSSGGTLNVGNIQVCNNTSSTQYVLMSINGTSADWTVPPDNVITVVDQAISPGITRTGINAVKGSGSPPDMLGLEFRHDERLGVHTIVGCNIFSILGQSTSFISSTPTLTLTEVGPPVTGYIAGYFAEQMNFTVAPFVRTVACSFRSRRL